MALLVTAFLASTASAALNSLHADIFDITLTKERLFRGSQTVPLTNANNSSVAVSGNAYYANPDITGTESFSDSTSGSSPAINHNGTLLQTMAGSINGTHLSASLDLVAPYALNYKPGYITETVTDTANYTTSGLWWLLPPGKLTIPYGITYSLQGNSIEPNFWAVTYTVTATVYVNGLPVMTTTLLDYSQSTGNPEVPLADIAPTFVGGTLERSFLPFFGARNVRVVFTGTMNG